MFRFRFKKWYPYFLLSPALLVLFALFLGGVILGLSQSLGYFPILGLEELTFRYYIEVWSSPEFFHSLVFSLFIAFTSSILTVIIGVFFAYQLVKLRGKNKIINFLYKLPIIVPHIIASLMVFLILTQSGILSRIAFHLGFIEEISQFPRLIFDKFGIGIIAAYLWKQIPFVILVVYTVLKHINNSFEAAAKNLGASSSQVFKEIYLPLAAPSIGSAFIIIFAFSLGAFEIPYLLGPTYPQTLSVLAYKNYISLDLTQRPYTMVIAMSLTMITVILIIIYRKILSLVTRYHV
jgi:putative spermidine/putrescine transport system permease protein